MKNLVILFGILMIILAIAGITENIYNISISNSGQPVKATISDLPRPCYSKHNIVYFEYDSKISNLPISKDFCLTSKIGDTLTLIQSNNDPQKFVFQGSTDGFYLEIVSCVLLVVLGVIIIFNSAKIRRAF